MPLDVLILEGWCVGARPQGPEALRDPVNGLERDEDEDGVWRRFANDALAGDYQRLFARIDHLILLAAPGFDVVAEWRAQQEHELIARGEAEAAMADGQIVRFVRHYERLTRHILAEMPDRADLIAWLNEDRSVAGFGAGRPTAPA